MGAAGEEHGQPKVFELAPAEGLQLAFGLGVLSLVVAVACAFAFGFGFLLLAAGTGPAIFYLISGAPQAIEVHADRVVIRYAMRRDRTIPASELMMQRMPGELVLIHGNDTLLFDAESVQGGALEACADAIQAIMRETS